MEYDESRIELIVNRIKYAVDKNKYRITINENREKNRIFFETYGIDSYRLKSILSELKVGDFSKTVQNSKPGYEDEKLLIFGPKVFMQAIGEDKEEEIVIYLKINIIERDIDDFVVIVSFHEAEKEMEYAFE